MDVSVFDVGTHCRSDGTVCSSYCLSLKYNSASNIWKPPCCLCHIGPNVINLTVHMRPLTVVQPANETHHLKLISTDRSLWQRRDMVPTWVHHLFSLVTHCCRLGWIRGCENANNWFLNWCVFWLGRKNIKKNLMVLVSGLRRLPKHVWVLLIDRSQSFFMSKCS